MQYQALSPDASIIFTLLTTVTAFAFQQDRGRMDSCLLTVKKSSFKLSSLHEILESMPLLSQSCPSLCDKPEDWKKEIIGGLTDLSVWFHKEDSRQPLFALPSFLQHLCLSLHDYILSS